MAAKLSSIPNRTFAGPATASASMAPLAAQRRARHCVPPPSTPSSSGPASAKSSFSTLKPLFSMLMKRQRARTNSDRGRFTQGPSGVPFQAMDTERSSPRYAGIDLWDPADILDALIEGQFAAVAAAREARFELERATLAIAERIKNEGRLVYVGAGTSGRLAVQDGAELMPTFNWPHDRLLLLIAGGRDALLRSVEGAEDEVEHAARIVRQHDISARDALIAVAASGTTPFTLSCLREAKARGALTVGLANNRGTPLLAEA